MNTIHPKKNQEFLLFEDLKKKVLQWLETMRINLYEYRMNEGADATIFSSCFALFILDFFRELENFSRQEKNKWASYIKSFQNPNTGLFEPKRVIKFDEEKLTRQMTCFCLSALDLLGTKPNYSLIFMDEYKTAEDIKNYLYNIGCPRGASGSGNKAMFLGIFLTYLIKYQKDDSARSKLDVWFDWHDKFQNPQNGFWGDGKDSLYYHGLQNGFHQLLIYFYWNKPILYLDKIVDTALKIQDREGFFAPIPGGGGCWDYDAIHILTNAFRILGANKYQISESLSKAYNAILSTQNNNGGFCQSKRKPNNLIDLFRYFPFLVHGSNRYLFYERIKNIVNILIKKREIIYTGWTEKGRRWEESNLWDTWLRCLTLAEISHTIELGEQSKLYNVNFHKMIGLGWFAN